MLDDIVLIHFSRLGPYRTATRITQLLTSFLDKVHKVHKVYKVHTLLHRPASETKCHLDAWQG